jgi:small-conductance mechanosensitive channel
MRRLISDMNPFVRGLIVVGLITLVVVVLQLQATLTALFLLAQIAFFLAIAFFIYLVWRERRSDIDAWSTRARAAFYGAAALIVLDLAAFFLTGPSGRDALAFFLVLIICGFAMFRVWRDQRSYTV